MKMLKNILLGGCSMILSTSVYAENVVKTPKYDISKEKILYTVGYAHLDTQWNWDYKKTIEKYILATMDENFAYFEKYPEYIFNFTGSVRYKMMEEYYPERFEKVKEYVKKGRWIPAAGSVDEGDLNVPSAESIIRHSLYGNMYFREKFNHDSVDILLPDCFGFPASMPSLWAHCGMKGLSTQKIGRRWGAAIGQPDSIGVWEGVDGNTVLTALLPGVYGTPMKGDNINNRKDWAERINENGEKHGLFAEYHYCGTGDVGGAVKEKYLKEYIEGVRDDTGLYKVRFASSDQLFKDITPEMESRLPRYKGDYLLTEHSAGTLTSQSYMKRWNRKNELLADAAERGAVMAQWLGASKYPQTKINNAWERVLASQMHDILPGTSIAKAYEYSWNDEVIALNSFASVLEDSIGAVILALDTITEGTPIVIYNPLTIKREDIVEAEIPFTQNVPNFLRVFNADGKEIPSQIISKDKKSIKIIFLAKVASTGFSVYDVRSANVASSNSNELNATKNSLENKFYKVSINSAGDIASIIDKKQGNQELLKSPARLEFLEDSPKVWPAWDMDWDDRQKDALGYVDGKAIINIVEDGPVRISLEVIRAARGSSFVQRISLGAGEAGSRVEVKNIIDWRSPFTCLKASFPLTVSNDRATYSLGLGTIERKNNDAKKYEVPSQEWFDLTDKTGKSGVAILEDCKYGSDKPADNIVRLTLLRSPKVVGKEQFLCQESQDFGLHEMVYGIYGHKGNHVEGRSQWQGRRLNQPLVPFTTPLKQKGFLGKKFSFVDVSSNQVDLQAVKKAENSDYTIVRIKELYGKPAKNVEITFANGINEVYEVDGQERKISSANLKDGKLVVDMNKFAIRSFAVKVNKPSNLLKTPASKSVTLEYTDDVMSSNQSRGNGDMDGKRRSYPAEMIPSVITSEGIDFAMGDKADNSKNAISCKGQTIKLPNGNYNKLYLLAAANKDTIGKFKLGNVEKPINVQSWDGFLGQWENRKWKNEDTATGLTPGYIKRSNLAWFASHIHSAEKDLAYDFSYMFKYSLSIPENTKKLTLPNNPDIKILAITVADNKNDSIKPLSPLYDKYPTVIYTDKFLVTDFVDESKVSGLATKPENATIHYTLDGSEPTKKSPVYKDKIEIYKSTLFRAIAFSEDVERSHEFIRQFNKIDPMPSVKKTDNHTAGLAYNLYKGKWKKMPDFASMKPAETGTIEDKLELPEKMNKAGIALEFEGFVLIPKADLYSFYWPLRINPIIHIDGVEICHKEKYPLQEGLHKINIKYNQYNVKRGKKLSLAWKSNDIDQAIIPASALYHK